MGSKYHTSFRLDARNAKRLERCKANGVNKVDIVCRALDEYFARHDIAEIAPDETSRDQRSEGGAAGRRTEHGSLPTGEPAPSLGDASPKESDGNDNENKQSWLDKPLW